MNVNLFYLKMFVQVYEHITYENEKPHISLASLPEMQTRSIITSSLSKTYSVTGGWVCLFNSHFGLGVLFD